MFVYFFGKFIVIVMLIAFSIPFLFTYLVDFTKTVNSSLYKKSCLNSMDLFVVVHLILLIYKTIFVFTDFQKKIFISKITFLMEIVFN